MLKRRLFGVFQIKLKVGVLERGKSGPLNAGKDLESQSADRKGKSEIRKLISHSSGSRFVILDSEMEEDGQERNNVDGRRSPPKLKRKLSVNLSS